MGNSHMGTHVLFETVAIAEAARAKIEDPSLRIADLKMALFMKGDQLRDLAEESRAGKLNNCFSVVGALLVTRFF